MIEMQSQLTPNLSVDEAKSLADHIISEHLPTGKKSRNQVLLIRATLMAYQVSLRAALLERPDFSETAMSVFMEEAEAVFESLADRLGKA